MGCLIAPDARKFEEATIYYLNCRKKKNGGAKEGGWDEANTESQERDHNPTNQQEEVDKGFFAISSDFQQQLAATLSLLSGMRREKGVEIDSITTRDRRLPRCGFYAHVKGGSALASLSTSSISERGELTSAVHLLLEPCFETRREKEGGGVGSKDKTCGGGGTGDQHFVFKGLKVVHCAPATGAGPVFFSSTFQEEEEILLNLFSLHSSLRTESLPQVANQEGSVLPLGDGAWSVKTTEEALMKAATMAGDRIARKKQVMISTSNEESYGTSRRGATLGPDFSWHYCAEIFSLLGKRQVSRNFHHQKVFRDSWEDLPISGKSPKNGIISESPKEKSSIFAAILSPMSSLFSES